jgi:hypothetical protein
VTYDPTRTSIRELILQDVETVLEAIAPPSYATTINAVRRWNANLSLDMEVFPAVAIVPGEEHHDDGRSQVIEHTMQVHLVFGTRGSDWPTAMNKLLADLRVALTNDPSRGGNAITTRITDDRIYDADGQQEVGGGEMLLTILYRTRYDDPTTAQ